MVREKVLSILHDVREDVDFEVETSLVSSEIIDSYDVIRIMTELINEFDIELDVDDITEDTFNSISGIVELVESKL